MKLYQYDDIKKLNQALGSFAKNNVPVIKVNVVSGLGSDKVQFFVMADPKEPIRVENKTEDEAKKAIKKEKKVELPKPNEGEKVIKA